MKALLAPCLVVAASPSAVAASADWRDDGPGVVHRITADSLASSFDGNGTIWRVVCRGKS